MRGGCYPWILALSLGLAACGSPGAPAPRPVGDAADPAAARILGEAAQERLATLDTDELTDNPVPEPTEGLFPGPPPDDLGNFGQLTDKLFRGARPTEKGVQMLKDKGVTLIINLENSRKVVEKERALAEKYGIRFKSIPMGIFIPPKLAKVDDFLGTVADPANGTVYFHCMQGRDRTGTMAYCHRIKVGRWDAESAYAEMKRYRFHTYLLGLNLFVHWYGRKYGPDGKTPVAPPPENPRLAFGLR